MGGPQTEQHSYRFPQVKRFRTDNIGLELKTTVQLDRGDRVALRRRLKNHTLDYGLTIF